MIRAFRMALALAGFTFLFAPVAQAGVLLEPYLGYGLKTTKADVSSGGAYRYGINGPVYGARVGYQAVVVFIAADYSTMSGTGKILETPPGVTLTENNWVASTLGVVAGIRVPFFRAFVGYNFIDTTTEKATTEITFSGNSMKAGVSYTGLPIIAINLEYVQGTFTKNKTGSLETDIGSSQSQFSKATSSTYLISVSAPFDI